MQLGADFRFHASDSPIARQWNIGQVPTFYILDAQGVIRDKVVPGCFGLELGKAVQTLLQEMVGGKAPPSGKK